VKKQAKGILGKISEKGEEYD